ncbi:cytochrome P450 6g1-like [Stomoxys calcitrans]|uniref:cytochrome P450 6g1-like n=1 Tax=Stomoxys calcitrans TaxID=35570 RepID=UPI0027E36491|nr:cytochrome P450 6g1-like [Stomoxys calcitrans]
MILLPLFVLAIVIISFVWYHSTFRYWDKLGIPNVRGFFSGSLGGIIRMKTNFGFHLKKVYLDPKFENAPVVGVYILHRPALLIRDPEMLKSIFIKKFDNFRNHFAQPDPHFDLVGSKAMIFSRGKHWRRIRSKLSTVFTGSKIRQMYPLLQEVGANLERRLRQKGKRFVAEMRELSALYSIDTNNSTIFGVSSNALDNPKDEFANDIRKIAVGDWRQSIRYAFIYFLPQLVGAFKLKLIAQETEDFLRTTMTKLICERERTCLQRNDIIDAFVEMKKEATAEGENMSTFMNTLTGLTWSFMFAGFDTSASTMSSALLELAKHPDVQNKLRTEIEHAICQNNDKLSYEALNNLKYLDMVVREALRMYPALAITEREHSADNKGNLFSLKPYFDYNLPDGMAVMISISGMHYDPKHWPNPNVFDPDRFSMKNRQSRHPMLFLSFGQGPRNCIGFRLGLLQVKIGLIACLKNHYVKLCDRTNLSQHLDPRTIVLQIEGGITLEMVNDDKCLKKLNVMTRYGPINKCCGVSD